MENTVINKFRGDYFFLSNFAPCNVYYNGKRFRTVEHAFQAAKCLTDEEQDIFKFVETPAEAKQWGKTVKLRPDWENVKIDIMKELLYQKFHNTLYKDKLLATKDKELVEGNEHKDTFWGVYRGEGKNILGKLLMEVRTELMKELDE